MYHNVIKIKLLPSHFITLCSHFLINFLPQSIIVYIVELTFQICVANIGVGNLLILGGKSNDIGWKSANIGLEIC